jgi:hypothetical protein
LVALTMIRFLAYTLSLVFYHRQVRSQPRGKCETFHECAKRIAYWFVAPAANTSWFSSCAGRDASCHGSTAIMSKRRRYGIPSDR